MSGEKPLSIAGLAEHQGCSIRKVGEDVRLLRVPHAKPPYSRKILLYLSEVELFLNTGCELEVRELPGGGRRVIPKVKS